VHGDSSSSSAHATSLRFLSSASSNSFISQAAEQYELQRHGEVYVKAESLLSPSPTVTTNERFALSQLGAAMADAAFLPIVLTPEEQSSNPDLIEFPIWAAAFGAVYNVPEAANTLVLSQATLAAIFGGNVTR